MQRSESEDLDGRLLHRMLFFTDAVFAIVMTLLVLELRPPEPGAVLQGADALSEMAGHLFAFAMSFGLCGVFWLAHMNSTRRMVRFDWPTTAANLVFLFPVCLLPFVSAWLGRGSSGDYVWGLYCWLLVATSAANVLLVAVMSRGRGRLLGGGMSRRELAYRIARAASPGLAFAVGLVLLALGQAGLAQMCWTLIALNFWLARLLLKPKAVPRDQEPEPRL